MQNRQAGLLAVILIAIVVVSDAFVLTRQPQIIVNGGGQSYFQCLQPLNWLLCYPGPASNNTNICTGANVRSASCPSDPKTTVKCANGQFATNVTESSNGVLTLNCQGQQTIWRMNKAILAVPTWVTDPFTTTSTTPVALPGLTATITQANAANGVDLMVLLQLTLKISAGTGFIQLECDGASCGSGGVFTNTGFQTVSIFLAQNNTFTDNGPHVIAGFIASDNAAHTVSVCASDSNCGGTFGNTVSLMSIYDLTAVA